MNLRQSRSVIWLLLFVPVLSPAETYVPIERQRAEIELALQRTILALDERLEAEAQDSEWATPLEFSISEGILALGGVEPEHLSITCKETLCRVKISPFSEAQEAALADAIWAVLESLPEIRPTVGRTPSEAHYYLFHRTRYYQNPVSIE